MTRQSVRMTRQSVRMTRHSEQTTRHSVEMTLHSVEATRHSEQMARYPEPFESKTFAAGLIADVWNPNHVQSGRCRDEGLKLASWGPTQNSGEPEVHSITGPGTDDATLGE